MRATCKEQRCLSLEERFLKVKAGGKWWGVVLNKPPRFKVLFTFTAEALLEADIWPG